MNNLKATLLRYLPLVIKKVEMNDDMLIMKGEAWQFSTLSAWRLIDTKKVRFGCWDKNAHKLVLALENLSIVSVHTQSVLIDADPTFLLSNGHVLEVFSTDTIEPWVMSIPNGLIYIGGR